MHDNVIFAQLLNLSLFSFQHHAGKNVPVLWKSWQTMTHTGYVKLLNIYLYSMPSRVGKRNWWVRQSTSNLNLIVNVASWKVLYTGAENGRYKVEITLTLLRSSCEQLSKRNNCCPFIQQSLCVMAPWCAKDFAWTFSMTFHKEAMSRLELIPILLCCHEVRRSYCEEENLVKVLG